MKVPQLILRCDHNRLLLLYFILSTNQTSCRESSWWVGSGHKGSIPSVYLSSQLLSQFKNGLLWVCFTSCSFTWSAFDLMVGNFPSNLASYLCLTVSVCYCAACIFCSDLTAPKLHTHQSHTHNRHTGLSLYSNNDVASCTRSLSLMTGYDWPTGCVTSSSVRGGEGARDTERKRDFV